MNAVSRPLGLAKLSTSLKGGARRLLDGASREQP
jgi:hypothetical protein